MSDAQRTELNAFLAFLATFDLARPVAATSDLSDGAALFEVLSLVDGDYFRQPNRPSAQPSENWVLRFSSLKRLYRLMTQYFSDVLHQPTGALDVPDLQAIAQDSNPSALLVMCRLTIAIAVQCENNKDIIERIQRLSDTEQHALMKAIEQVMAKVKSSGQAQTGETSMTEDDHYYQIQSERRRVLSEKETLEQVYQTLLSEHRTLQTNFDDIVQEKEDALAQVRQAQRDAEDRRVDSRGDAMLRAEIDRLRGELQKSEDNLAMAEAELDKQTGLVSDLKKRVDELQSKADEAARLKDQLDEYRHTADRLQKTENVMEKYKRKLQEGADLRQQVRALEKQNADLVDKNASLEEEYRKVAAFKPLMESYRTQIAELESKSSARSKEVDTVRFELDQTKAKLKLTQEERQRDNETLELYQERVRELELLSHRPVASTPRPRPSATSATAADGDEPARNTDEMTLDELNADASSRSDDMDDVEQVQGLGDELDAALAGTTMTDLKIQIRKLERELEAVKKQEADASRVLVLENLLEDATRMKTRYEQDYLATHREKLQLQNDLEEIRSGKALGDGPEAAIALRQRLNETVEQLDVLRKEHAELEVKFQAQSKELTIAKSDLNLVHKDQLEILASLRESVNEDKAGLETEVQKLHDQIRELSEKSKMQLEQINALLMEKVNLQSEGLDQRDRMLQRERDISNLRASLSGKDIPEDVKQRLLKMHEDQIQMQEQYKTVQEKLNKARQFIKQQDKLFKEEQAKKGAVSVGCFRLILRTLSNRDEQGVYGESGEDSAKVKILEEEIARKERLMAEMTKRYQREQALMLSIIHSHGMDVARGHLAKQQRTGPTSWLGQQRRNVSVLTPYPT
ncbi:uncharacterized protein PHACADRAFT_94105 [Phanerochaete carnosa HHB-10118-sp]|uniref:HOOK N-terminal domain-containing protein n=1 Tax=Phanerochaete carnosa (strain HHB-10118-sp) TaxID=650164 RepID=K5W973_PHACS|nr:uncharacterized protein PHACADRAFT_94105 [Phanerochaete carnosa HHB-10118-sp]EKM55760.1 hypothetical protein PHACADRAFT_94105 [Phanerochaete carnosa HHB-10118-sp]